MAGRVFIWVSPPAGQAYYEQLRAEYGIFTAALEGLMARDGALYPEGTEDV